MAIVYEVIRKLNEMRKTYGYDFNIPNIYGIADFRRNEFVFIAKKAVREVIREHEPYQNPSLKTALASCLMAFIMRVYNNPNILYYYVNECEEIYALAKYGLYTQTLCIYGMGLKQRLITYGMP